MSPPAESRAIGTHRVFIEGDTVLLVQKGDFTLSDALQMNAEIEAVLARLGRGFIMVDQTHGGKTPPEARRCIVEWNKKYKASGAAIFGGSPAIRAVATLATTAIRLFRSDSTETVFTASEAEARAWIHMKREKLLGQRPHA